MPVEQLKRLEDRGFRAVLDQFLGDFASISSLFAQEIYQRTASFGVCGLRSSPVELQHTARGDEICVLHPMASTGGDEGEVEEAGDKAPGTRLCAEPHG